MIKRIGLLYHPKVDAALVMAKQLSELLTARGATPWLCSAWDESVAKSMVPESELLIGLGGDGTVIRAVRAAVPFKVPVLGVNFGRLGFMAELTPEEALQKIPALLDGGGYVIEERAMLESAVNPHGGASSGSVDDSSHALNDVVVARGAPGRPIYVEVIVDGESVTTYRADGIIVSSATGSTGYSFSAGGPVLHPGSKAMVVTPVSPHVALPNSLVLPSTSVVELRVRSDHQPVLSIDGQGEKELKDGDCVVVRKSPHQAHFVRTNPGYGFFGSLMHRLRWEEDALP